MADGDTRVHIDVNRIEFFNDFSPLKSNTPNRTGRLNWSAMQVNVIFDKIPYTEAIESVFEPDDGVDEVFVCYYILIILYSIASA